MYRATIVQIANRSRRRRGLPELDRYGRRCLIASTVIMGTFLAICAHVTFLMATTEPSTRDVPYASSPVSTTRYVPPTAPVEFTAPTSEPEASVPVSEPDVDVHVDTDHHDLPDGALTGGYCRRKWWC